MLALHIYSNLGINKTYSQSWKLPTSELELTFIMSIHFYWPVGCRRRFTNLRVALPAASSTPSGKAAISPCNTAKHTTSMAARGSGARAGGEYMGPCWRPAGQSAAWGYLLKGDRCGIVGGGRGASAGSHQSGGLQHAGVMTAPLIPIDRRLVARGPTGGQCAGFEAPSCRRSGHQTSRIERGFPGGEGNKMRPAGGDVGRWPGDPL